VVAAILMIQKIKVISGTLLLLCPCGRPVYLVIGKDETTRDRNG